MRLVCLADSHNKHHEIPIPDGDVLIHAGDCTDGGTRNETMNFLEWFSRQPHRYKILVPGNHDFFFEKRENLNNIPFNIHVLIDEGVNINRIKFWGSPVTPGMHNWAFNRDRGKEIRKHWKLIPAETDILVTHTPPNGIKDEIRNGIKLGCEELSKILEDIEPDYHLFGHIHHSSGRVQRYKTDYFNLSILDDQLRVARSPYIIDI